MPFVPISFVVAGLIAVLALRLWARDERPGAILFALLAALFGLSVLIGLRWGYGVKGLLPVQALLAAAWPPLAWLAFHRIGERPRRGDLVHLLPVAAVGLVMVAWPDGLDVAITAIFVGYGAALLRLTWLGPDALVGARIADSLSAQRAALVTGLALMASAVVDGVIALDFSLTRGDHVGLIIGLAQSTVLALLAAAAGVAGRAAPAADTIDDAPMPAGLPTPDEAALVERLDALVREQKLHLMPDLTLGRLARRMVVPARQISEAVNRVRGESVSRYLNRFRVDAACRLLADTSLPVTAVMLEAGFQTKSNFNRVFRDATGMGPSEWRSDKVRREDH